MNSTHELLDLADHAARVVEGVLGVADGVGLSDGVTRMTADELRDALVLQGELLRRVEGLAVVLAGEVAARSSDIDGKRFDLALGCTSATSVLEVTTGVSFRRAKELQEAARAIRHRLSLTGEELPPSVPCLRDSLLRGHLGLEGFLAASKPLLDCADRVDPADLAVADACVAALVTGDPTAGRSVVAGESRVRPACVSIVRDHARVFALRIDQDGACPTDDMKTARRALRIGRQIDGLVSISGQLLPEVAAQLQKNADAILNPHAQAAGVRFRDEWESPDDGATRPQRMHDALATMLMVAARSGELPTLQGDVPTLVVTVSAASLVAGRGFADADGFEISLAAARQVSCGGGIQRVAVSGGAVLALGSEQRIFTKHQRRAIAARDGGCVMFGCQTSVAWCEVHHVTEWAEGGATHTDNGVLLCWSHHRFLDDSGWKIRMARGAPELQAPSWMDPDRRWFPARGPRPRFGLAA